MDFFTFVKENLSHVAPLVLAAALGVAIIAERARALFVQYPMKDSEGFMDRIRELVMGGNTASAVALCDERKDKPLARLVKTALLRAHQPEAVIENGLELTMGELTHTIQKRTSFLATIANVATLLGLFGTILGLIQSFQAVGHADAQQKSALLAAGISTSMNATMFGLGIAIPCMVAFSLLVNRANSLVGELERSSLKIMDILKQRFYGAIEETHANGHDKTEEKSNVTPIRKSA
ncbi:MAG TPA: MotA/TolQ/ExbB proton channel family protein [Bdellovibrionota bacterium]|nr:MotA/TolQ/ExbB proton channel family protein [Bdellovibrionota bacterium]